MFILTGRLTNSNIYWITYSQSSNWCFVFSAAETKTFDILTSHSTPELRFVHPQIEDKPIISNPLDRFYCTNCALTVNPNLEIQTVIQIFGSRCFRLFNYLNQWRSTSQLDTRRSNYTWLLTMPTLALWNMPVAHFLKLVVESDNHSARLDISSFEQWLLTFPLNPTWRLWVIYSKLFTTISNGVHRDRKEPIRVRSPVDCWNDEEQSTIVLKMKNGAWTYCWWSEDGW